MDFQKIFTGKSSKNYDNPDPSFSINDQPLLQRIHWFRFLYLSTMPSLALYGILTTELLTKTAIFHIIYLSLNSICITAGYHRYWCHKSYKASKSLQLFMAILSCASAQGSIYWWCRDHRIHHRYTDTPKDPYNAKAGFFYSHIGWLFLKRDRRKLGYVDTSDLQSDKLVMFQHNFYVPLVALTGYIIPIGICGLGWGDWRGGFFYANICRTVYIHHTTFCVNSVAHYIGDLTYGDSTTAKDSIITAILTLGEGYHNFHHEFPSDYRNGIRFYHYDPTKWLPTFTMDEFTAQVKKSNKQWIIIQGVIYDVTTFMFEHPGGIPLLDGAIGKDMSEAFNGGVYNHQNAARNLLGHLRVGSVVA
ncbi:hypothetical protein BB561_005723 [Smittium simulii]|uniref:Cytochrome b5 heme-binding domain-containing protein n=1 Tax=Smittium simulii TaxID=133385 RepID=A0A2T9Y8T6_9FUNG|nr:hypothetical protein BB561_005723 [Smittium simulii]